MRRLALIGAVLAAIAAAFVATAPAGDSHTYTIEMYNAFGVVTGSDVRVAGVNAGSVSDLDVNDKKRAVVTVELSGPVSVLGTDTRCSSEPQSLIAEYFIDCDPHGPPIQHSDDLNHPDIPASHVKMTVQNDLVQDTLREPYKRRLQLLINEFGTALAGNPQNLNKAIRLGAPALTQLKRVTSVLADQNTTIRDLNVDSDRIIGALNQRSADVVAFIKNARDTAAASAERGNDLSQDFGKLDDFLAELKPTLVKLDQLAVTQTPVLQDLRASAGGLDRLVLNLPAFNSATKTSLLSLGDASKVGRSALRQGKDEIRLLAQSGQKAPETGEILADFLRDIDDPSRAVEQDTRAAADTGDPSRQGYTGLEGLLNYIYYQTGSLNQYDSAGHLLHFSLYFINTGPCGSFTTGREPDGTVSLPTNTPGVTTSNPQLYGPPAQQVHNCIGWLGPNQPGVNNMNFNLPPYDPSACPHGISPANATTTSGQPLCSPSGPKTAGPGPKRPSKQSGGGAGGGAGGSELPQVPSTGGGPGVQVPDLPNVGGGGAGDVNDALDQILGGGGLGDLPRHLRQRLREQASGGGTSGGGGGATQDLLDFLLGP